MTENEAIISLSQMYLPHFDDEEKQALSKAIEVLQEIKRYRLIGTVEECREAINSLKSKEKYIKQILWERDIAIQQLEEVGVSLGEKMDSVKEARGKAE